MSNAFIRLFTDVKGCGVFHEWQNNTQFGRYNLIYGSNGSGKTTISRLLRSLERGEVDPAFYDEEDKLPDQFSFKIKLADNSEIKHDSLTGWEKKLRVFNCDFVKDNLNVDEGTAEPVYYLGEDQSEALKQLEIVGDNLDEKKKELEELKTDIKTKEETLGQTLTSQARTVSELLGERAFNRTSLTRTLGDETFQSKWSSHQLSDQERQVQVDTSRNANQKTETPLLTFAPSTGVEEIKSCSEEVLQRTITRKVIDELEENTSLKAWAQEGIALHEDKTTCAFCASDIKPSRIEELNAYFNEAYKTLLSDSDKSIANVKNIIDIIRGIKPIDTVHIQESYKESYKTAAQRLSNAGTAFINQLSPIMEALQEKKNNSFTHIDIENVDELDAANQSFKDAIGVLDTVIRQHNEHCKQSDQKVQEAKERVKNHYAADIYEFYIEKHNEIEAIKGQAEALENNDIPTLKSEYNRLDELLKEHYPALSRINELMSAFMGRDDIALEANEKGYSIKRNSRIAKNLSEGERTAIAFCYFISKMEEKDFNITQSIIVVDDPISSLDTNALYAAGAFIRMHLESAHQLFILTHNHRFFREMYGWVQGLDKKQKPAEGLCFRAHFMVKCAIDNDGIRKSRLTKLDSLLQNYDNEYVYHCKLLFDSRNQLQFDSEPSAEQLSQLILLPNVARKVMETFLLFKYPNQVKERMKVYKAAEKFTQGIEQEKLSMLDRLINRASHGDDGKMSSVNVFDLDETPKVISYVLDFIKHADEVHYSELELACGIQPANDDIKAVA